MTDSPEENSLLSFPMPTDGLTSEQRLEEIVRLATEIATLLGGENSPEDLRSVLATLEAASAKLKELGALVLKGVERLRADENHASIIDLVESTNGLLDRIKHITASQKEE